jgi:hypothetical protein
MAISECGTSVIAVIIASIGAYPIGFLVPVSDRKRNPALRYNDTLLQNLSLKEEDLPHFIQVSIALANQVVFDYNYQV